MDILKTLGFAAVIDGTEVTEKDFALSGDIAGRKGTYNGITVTQSVRSTEGGVLVSFSLAGLAPHRCSSFCPVTLSGSMIGRRQYVSEGWTNKFFVIEANQELHPAFLSMTDENGAGLFVRSVWPLKFRERYEAVTDEASTQCRVRVYLPESYNGNEVASADVFVSEGDLNEALKQFNALLPTLPRNTAPVVGYNTWDYYFSDISLEKVKENLDVIAKTPFLKEHLRYFTIDDGWQTAWGEWVPNYRFPGGIEAYCALVRSYGLVPGIWTAPLNVQPVSAVAQRNLRGFSPNALGDPKRIDGMYYLDPTHPDTRKAMRELFGTLYKAGVRLFKIDYVSRVRDMDYFYDPTAGPFDALRTLCADIRSVVGEDSIILGCSMPEECCSPDVDCGRTGFDMHNVWGHATWSMEGYQYRWRDQPKIWVNDIDFLLVRGPETDHDDQPRNTLDPGAHEPNHGRWRGGPDFTEIEAQTWAAVVMLTGGNMILSDRLSVLNEKGMAIIRKALENRSTVPATPLDQFKNNYPALWVQENKQYIINWSDETQAFTVPVEGSVFELWSEQTLAAENGFVTVTLPPHGSAVLIGR